MKREEAIRYCDEYLARHISDIDKEFLKIAKEALQQKPCTDAISRQAVLDILKEKWNKFSDANDAMQESIDTIEALKPVTPQPKRGRWIEHFDESGKWYECDQCHTDWGGSVNYCPNCGTKMEG